VRAGRDAVRPYADRAAAGRALADALTSYAARPQSVVLALPRGGLPVAAVVADSLGASLDVVVVRKIGAPGRPELAIGAVAGVAGHRSVFCHQDLVRQLGITAAQFEAARDEQETELERRLARFGHRSVELEGAYVVIVDDGLATGSTMSAAVAAVRAAHPAAIIAAAPVGARSAVQALGRIADEVVCPRQPEPFEAVGYAYEDFSQVGEAEALALLRERS